MALLTRTLIIREIRKLSIQIPIYKYSAVKP